LSRAGLGRFWARSAQLRELESQANFCQDGKQRTILPISRQPNFTKFEHNTSIGVEINPFGTEFGKFSSRGRFFKKTQKMIFFNVLRHQAAIE